MTTPSDVKAVRSLWARNVRKARRALDSARTLRWDWMDSRRERFTGKSQYTIDTEAFRMPDALQSCDFSIVLSSE
jgi:hypothetical protein